MTTSEENLAFEQLARLLAPQSTLLRTWQLKGGISAEMTALELKHPDGQTSRMIVRRPGAAAVQRNPDAAKAEFKLLQLAQSAGLAAQTPYYLDQSGAIFPAPYLVIEYIDGEPEFAPAHLDDFTCQLATQLATIHSIDPAKFDSSFLPKATHSLGERPARVDHSLAEGRIRDTLEAVWPLPQRNAPALLHGDFWPGNVLWRDRRIVAVIDWEDATSGDPLVDFAISRLDTLWIYGLDAMHAFTEHYTAQMALDYTDLPYWDLYAALRFVRLAGAQLAEWAAFFHPFGRYDITEHTMREYYSWFIKQAFEKGVSDRP